MNKILVRDTPDKRDAKPLKNGSGGKATIRATHAFEPNDSPVVVVTVSESSPRVDLKRVQEFLALN